MRHDRSAPARRASGTTPLALPLLLALLASGCGGGKSGTGEGTAGSGAPAASAPAPATAAGAPAAFDPATTFKEKCALCHGPEGRGDGPGGAALNPKPRNFHDAAYMRSRTDAQLHESLWNGKSGMPAWGKTGVLSAAQVDSMIRYVRRLSATP